MPSLTIWCFIIFYSVIVLLMHYITVCVLYCPDCMILYVFLCLSSLLFIRVIEFYVI